MNVFLLGATGHMGRAIAAALQLRGHSVLGLARTDAATEALWAAGVTPHYGHLTDLESLKSGARLSDGVIDVARAPGLDVADSARDALLEGLAGTQKPFVKTTGSNLYGETGPAGADEETPPRPPIGPFLASHEQPVLRTRAVRGVVIRPGFVHGGPDAPSMQSLLRLTQTMKAGVYVGEGENLWSFVHVADVADLYVRALEGAAAGFADAPGTGTSGVAGLAFNAAAEPPIAVRDLAQALSHAAGFGGRTLSLAPEEVASRLGERAASFLGRNKRIRADRARELLGWRPVQPSVLAELRREMP